MSFFGSNIKKIRQVKGLSQKAFADLFDLNRGVISSYEEGRAEPKIETILKVANHFNLNLDKFLTETLQADELESVSNTDQLMLFPEFSIQNDQEIQVIAQSNSPNALILQKILASVDLIYEFTTEKPLLPQYQYGDILFLNKADLITDSIDNLLIHINGTLQYATDNQLTNKQNQEYYKVVGYVSTTEKNIFESIFERLEKLENKG
ncbi:Transcriptional regulator, contains XRE-family HTH domain [Chryseobacterium rhizoplanae]|uniref:Transcriptional regulator, contains XRE-family HTH domain n=1 Tax=Chryseobacterium rhizoplanae TaxID=1609531 RepID=A0A521C9L6_9FLAO|nr:helix-turn-helix transcriptional regulator [Chryseobacterium rhizoplanae]SMO56177.1 Transcriptional regulator, contains XRE-family HTH domain [Chryseobacterium rhizoplanae]